MFVNELAKCLIRALFYISICYISFVDANSDFSDVEKVEMVNSHNKWRVEVKTHPIIWSNELAEIARKYANDLKLTKCDVALNYDDHGKGKNVLWSNSKKVWWYHDPIIQYVDMDEVVRSWAMEKSDYNYKTNSCFEGKNCEHYLQIIWKETKEVGCEKVICNDNSQIFVCSYNPVGNLKGKKPY